VSLSWDSILMLARRTSWKGGEEDIIPAIERARSQGIKVRGPFPADSFFNVSAASSFDVVVAMYHDQGLIPMKMFDFQRSVNFTLDYPSSEPPSVMGQPMTLLGRVWLTQTI